MPVFTSASICTFLLFLLHSKVCHTKYITSFVRVNKKIYLTYSRSQLGNSGLGHDLRTGETGGVPCI